MAEKLGSLRDLFIAELQDIYDAELQITEALPKMIDAATSTRLKSRFETHLKQTHDQVDRLRQVFAKLEMEPSREHCVGMAGLIKEGEKLLREGGEPSVLDAGLIGTAQKVEHYEISSYGTLRTFARTLGMPDIADLLQTTLEQESHTDELLTSLAETSVNKKAA